jgi:outer membrane protein OmpA-like peptidoglycan-associated protein
MKTVSLAFLGALLVGLPLAGRARADGWLVAETPVAIAVSDAQQGSFRAGFMPAFGVYLDRGLLAFGARVRAGALRNGPAPAGNVEDPGLGGLVTGSFAARLAVSRGWIELAAGAGVTGSDPVPAVEAGAGWTFASEGFEIGPSLRYVQVLKRNEMDNFGSAALLLIGVDARFGALKPRREPMPALPVAAAAAPPPAPPAPPPAPPAPPPAPPAPPPAPPAEEPVAPAERDGDEVHDSDASCVELAEGCPLTRNMEIEVDRIVLDNQVLFELNQAVLRPGATEAIAQIAQLWALHPEWRRITVEGHTCELGSDDFNQALSLERAQRTREAMIAAGLAADRIDAVGYGRTRPRDPAHTEEARAHNRRVEFAIERGGAP